MLLQSLMMTSRIAVQSKSRCVGWDLETILMSGCSLQLRLDLYAPWRPLTVANDSFHTTYAPCQCHCCAGNSYARGGILHFLLYDPSYNPIAISDPRPALPPTFTDPSLGRVLAKTGWTQAATSFAYKCSW
jgi:hypothetical protein